MNSLNDLLGLPSAPAPEKPTEILTLTPTAPSPLAALAALNANPQQALAGTQTASTPKPQPAPIQAPVSLGDLQLAIGTPVNSGPAAYDFPDQEHEGIDSVLTATLGQLLTNLQASLGTEQVNAVLTETMAFIEQHPDMQHILRPEDAQVCVRAIRASSGNSVTTKTERAKKSGGRQSKKAQLDAEIANDLDGIIL